MRRKYLLGAVAAAAAAGMMSDWAAPVARADQTVSFQNGVNGYTGSFDRGVTTDTVGGSTSADHYNIDGYVGGPAPSPDSPMLLRFDNLFGSGAGQVPSGAFILDAQLQMTTHNSSTSNSPGPIGIAPLLKPFTSTTKYVDYDISGGADLPGIGGNRGPWFENAQSARPVAGYNQIAISQVVTQHITPVLQAWSSGALANNGIAFQTGFTGTTDAWSARASGHVNVADRPKLSVTYTTDPVNVASFQQGVNGYGGTTMAYITKDLSQGDATTDGNFEAQNWLDKSSGPTDSVVGQSALIKFDNIFGQTSIPTNAVIRKAFLVITTASEASSPNARSGGSFEADEMNQSWDTNSQYSSFDATNGPTGTVRDTIGGLMTDSQAWFDVTGSLKAFEGGKENDGWVIRSAGTSDGWMINFAGADDASARPQLVVDWTPAPGAFVWNLPAGGNWADAASWTGGGTPNQAGASATLGSAATANAAVNVASNVSVGSITFDNASHSYTVGGTGTITLNTITGPAAISVISGSHTISAPVALGVDTTVTVTPLASTLTLSNLAASTVAITKAGAGTLAVNNVRAGSLTVSAGKVQVLANGSAAGASKVASVTISPGAKLDLTNNKLIVTAAGQTGSWNGSAYTGVTGLVAAGKGDGNWNGTTGIVTSVAGASDYTSLGVASGTDVRGLTGTATDTFAGQTIHAGDTVVMFTYGGDANLDGLINIDDYTQIDSSVAVGGALKGWFNGDFNYDGEVNIDDYTIIDSNIGIQGAPFSTAGGASPAGMTAVPEPTALALLTMFGISMTTRRRKR